MEDIFYDSEIEEITEHLENYHIYGQSGNRSTVLPDYGWGETFFQRSQEPLRRTFRTYAPIDSKKNKILEKTKEKEKKEEIERRERQKDKLKRFPPPEKELINVLTCGHVDAGKSTMLGHFLHLLGKVSKSEMHKITKESKEKKKASFKFAWVLDDSETERRRGVTVDVGTKFFETEKKRFMLLDSPGHRDFVPNLLAEASASDVALLVVDCSPGNFESGFAAGGQTKEHLFIARGIGVTKVIVAVNKMDTCGWSKERFNEVKSELMKFIAGQNFKKVVYIPTSGLAGLNLTERYTGFDGGKHASLLETLESLRAPKRRILRPARFCVSSTDHSYQYGEVYIGKVMTGIIAVGETLKVLPGGPLSLVKAIHRDSQAVEAGFAGENVEVAVNAPKGVIKRGCVLCPLDSPARVVTRYLAKIVTLKLRLPLIPGQALVVNVHNDEVVCRIEKIRKKLCKKTGAVLDAKPRCLKGNSAAIVALRSEDPFCAETFRENSALSRLTLRHEGCTVAAGVIEQILE